MKTLKLIGLALLACVMLISCKKHEQFTITVNANDNTMGTVTGGGVYEKNSMATLTAIPKANCIFVKWKNGSTVNPRKVTVTADASYTAIFEYDGEGIFGDGVIVEMGENTWMASSFHVDDQAMPGKIRFWLYRYEGADYPQFHGLMDISSTGTVEAHLVYMENENDVDAAGSPNWEAVDLTTTLTAIDIETQTITAEQTGKLRNRTTGEEISLHIVYANATWVSTPESSKKKLAVK